MYTTVREKIEETHFNYWPQMPPHSLKFLNSQLVIQKYLQAENQEHLQ